MRDTGRFGLTEGSSKEHERQGFSCDLKIEQGAFCHDGGGSWNAERTLLWSQRGASMCCCCIGAMEISREQMWTCNASSSLGTASQVLAMIRTK